MRHLKSRCTVSWTALQLLRSMRADVGKGSVVFATLEADLIRICRQEGIEVVDYAGLRMYLGDKPNAGQEELAEKIGSVIRGRIYRLVAAIILTVMAAIGLVFLIPALVELIVAAKPIWAHVATWACIGAGLLAYPFFWFRTHYRDRYGWLEVFAGLTGAMMLGFATEPLQDVDSWLKLLAAIYVIVRGLDNVDRGLSDRKSAQLTAWNAIWFKDPPTK